VLPAFFLRTIFFIGRSVFLCGSLFVVHVDRFFCVHVDHLFVRESSVGSFFCGSHLLGHSLLCVLCIRWVIFLWELFVGLFCWLYVGVFALFVSCGFLDLK
jgi:hypothetical protein